MNKTELNINGKRIVLYGSKKIIENEKPIIENLELTGNENTDRLLIQRCIDENKLKSDILYDGNTVYPFEKIVKAYRKLQKRGSLDNLSNDMYHFFIYACGDIAHYDLGGFKAYYNYSFQQLENTLLKDNWMMNTRFSDVNHIFKELQIGKYFNERYFTNQKQNEYDYDMCGKAIMNNNKTYTLIEKYAIPKDKKDDFFNHFTVEQLDDFEDLLQKYFIEGSIIYNEDSGTLEAKEEYLFNSDILRLACGLITYKDFINEYKENSISNFDLALPKVISYFRENEIKNLMDYGSDNDERLYKLSDMYKELLDKSNIQYFDINTRDKEGSDGRYVTTVSFDSNTEIELETEAWNGIKAVTENIAIIYENYKIFYENSIRNEVQNDKEFEYDYN